ncbi:MAG TPA: hypothetical protein DIW66_06595 [Serratia liquefaciens]|nr:hypothetical protein [Serratia liquefaciens]
MVRHACHALRYANKPARTAPTSPSSFRLQRRWLPSLIPVTELSQLPGTLSIPALLEPESYWA